MGRYPDTPCMATFRLSLPPRGKRYGGQAATRAAAPFLASTIYDIDRFTGEEGDDVLGGYGH
jgi:hypothetical protein